MYSTGMERENIRKRKKTIGGKRKRFKCTGRDAHIRIEDIEDEDALDGNWNTFSRVNLMTFISYAMWRDRRGWNGKFAKFILRFRCAQNAKINIWQFVNISSFGLSFARILNDAVCVNKIQSVLTKPLGVHKLLCKYLSTSPENDFETQVWNLSRCGETKTRSFE